MPDLELAILLPAGEMKKVEMPADVPISELQPDLVAALGLPSRGPDGRILAYRLESKSLGRPLHSEETLLSAKVAAGDTLILSPVVTAGGGPAERGRITVTDSPIGLPLEGLKAVEVEKLLSNEPALMMTLHSYRSTLHQIAHYREELERATREIDALRDRVKGSSISTALLVLGQIQTGFGANLITVQGSGGWFVFASGVAVSLGAFYFLLPWRGRRHGSQPSATTPSA